MLFEHVNRIGKNVTRINPFIFELIPVFSKKTRRSPGSYDFLLSRQKNRDPLVRKMVIGPGICRSIRPKCLLIRSNFRCC